MSKSTLEGKLLLAMPTLVEPTFAQSVVFLCAHSAEGAMGIIVNKPMPGMSFLDLADRVDYSRTPGWLREILAQSPVLMGGPVEQQRGFVLHSTDYSTEEGSLKVSDSFALTATVNILEDIASGKGPQQQLLALGYAGWAPGQLESEIMHNGWLHCDAEPSLVFSPDHSAKYTQALKHMGVDPRMLSTEAGHD